MTYGHLQADCLYTGISSGPNARYRVWEAFTFTFIMGMHIGLTWQIRLKRPCAVLRRCGLMSNYFDHLFLVSYRSGEISLNDVKPPKHELSRRPVTTARCDGSL